MMGFSIGSLAILIAMSGPTYSFQVAKHNDHKYRAVLAPGPHVAIDMAMFPNFGGGEPGPSFVQGLI